MTITAIDLPMEKIAKFCDRWQIIEFALFGSVLRDDFRLDSDIDIMVQFHPEAHPTFLSLEKMEDELKNLKRNRRMTDLKNSDFHLPYNPKLIARAKELRKNMTPAEKKLWNDYLRTFQFRVLRQRPIDHFIVDFYCPSLKLAIEVDGESHFTDEGKEYDRERTERLEGYGLTIIRFTNEQVLRDFEGVCAAIQSSIPPSPP